MRLLDNLEIQCSDSFDFEYPVLFQSEETAKQRVEELYNIMEDVISRTIRIIELHYEIINQGTYCSVVFYGRGSTQAYCEFKPAEDGC